MTQDQVVASRTVRGEDCIGGLALDLLENELFDLCERLASARFITSTVPMRCSFRPKESAVEVRRSPLWRLGGLLSPAA